MGGTIVVNGKETGIPGIYAIPEYAKLSSRPPLSAVLAVVGEFPFLKKNTPYVSLTQADFNKLAPSNSLLKKMSNIIYNPSDDPAISNSPAAVYLVSPRTNTQAYGMLEDVNNNDSIKISAKQWGLEGNRTHFSIVTNTVRGGWDVVIRNGTYVESFNVQPEPTLMTLDFNPDPVVSPFDVSYTPSLSVVDGTVKVTFTKALDETDADVAPGGTSWDSMAPVDGNLSILPMPGGTISGTGLTIHVTGVDKETGLTATKTTNFSVGEITALTPVAKPNGPWTGPVTMVIEQATALNWNGDVTVSGNVFPDFNAANGQTYVADVISYISAFASYGFEVSTASTRTASFKLVDLDDLAADPLPASLTATLWRILTSINNRSLLVTAEREGDLPPDVTSTPTAFFLSGGTETAAVANDWRLALAELEWLDVDVLVPFYDPTGVTPASDTVLPLFMDHLSLMWSNGANERFCWFPAGDDETLGELRVRQVAFGRPDVATPIDRVSLVQFNNQVESLAPYWNALLHAAMDASTSGGVSFTYRSPRVVGYTRNSSLYGRDAREALITSGFCFLVQDPGMVAPQIQRDQTTYTADQDPRLTSRVARRSLMRSIKSMRRTLRRYQVTPEGSIPTVGDIQGGVQQELETQRQAGIIAGFDPGKIVINSYADRTEVSYEISVQIERTFIILRPTVSAPSGTVIA